MKYKEAIEYYNQNKEIIKQDDNNFAHKLREAYREEFLYSNYTTKLSFCLITEMYINSKEKRGNNE